LFLQSGIVIHTTKQTRISILRNTLMFTKWHANEVFSIFFRSSGSGSQISPPRPRSEDARENIVFVIQGWGPSDFWELEA